MADPTEELEDELVTQFDAYMVQIKRLLTGAVTRVKRALNSDRINGYTLAQLIAIIRGEVKAHEDANNPHNETLSQLSGMSRTVFDSQMVNYFKKDAVPISKIPLLVTSVNGNQLSVGSNQMIYMGRRVDIPGVTLTLTGTAKLYLKVNVANPQPGRTSTLTLESDDSENIKKYIAGWVTLSNGIWTVTRLPGVFLGTGRLATLLHGSSIPTSPGTQATPGSIDSGWIS